MPEAVWGVEVNECSVNAVARAAEWWVLYRIRFDPTGRITALVVSLGGDLVHVACDSKDDANELMDMFIERGIHKSALKVKQLAKEPGAGKTTDAPREGIDRTEAANA